MEWVINLMLNKWFKKSILSKVFIMNLLLLAFIVSIQLVFQFFFFENYYVHQKEQQITEEVQNFSDFLSKKLKQGKLENRVIMDYIKQVNMETGIDLSLRFSNLHEGISIQDYMTNSYIPIIDSTTNIEYKIIVGDFFPEVQVGVNDKVHVIGTMDAYGYIVPAQLSINDVQIPSYYSSFEILDDSTFTFSTPFNLDNKYYQIVSLEGYSSKGVVKEERLTANSNLYFYLSSEVINNILSNATYTATVNNILGNGEMIVSSQSFNENYIVAVSFLTSINDVVGLMNSYYIIVFLIALLVVVIISLIYSRYMTKPLIQMSYIAKEISKSNFDIKYPVKTSDEIGILGASLNSISDNLKKSLKDLRTSNERLKEEMDVQKLQEEKRKELIANISHELKTPITIVQGNIEGLQQGMYSEEVYQDILEETIRMNDLVMEMLEISKLESPTFKLDVETFDLYGLVLKEIDKLKPLVKEKQLEISILVDDNLEDEELFVIGDEKRIAQVLRNFMTNAIKYTKEGEQVKLSIQELSDSYQFRIENFGVTLVQKDLDNIWDAFYRKEKSRNKKFGGTGLGLYIVKRILELHQSDYGVISTENSVCFYFSLKKCVEG